jgi:hypothetical protein
MGSAISIVICFFVMMVINYFWGQKYYPIPYDLKRIAKYFGIGTFIFLLSLFTSHLHPSLKFSINTMLFIIFLGFVFRIEIKELSSILGIKKG